MVLFVLIGRDETLYRSTGAFYDTVVIKSTLDVKADTAQLEKKNASFIYRLERISVATVDIYGVHG